MKKLTMWLSGVGLAFAVAAAPAVAEAGVVTVWPEQLIQEDSTPITRRGPGGLVAEGSFYKVLNLPVGSILDGFKVTYSGEQEGYDWCTYVRRVKLGGLPEDIISFGRLDYNPAPTPVVGITTIEGYTPPVVPVALRRIAPGYRYYLYVDPDNAQGTIYSVQVRYR